MEILAVPRVLLSGTHTGVGKTLLGIGLTHELRRRNVSLSCCVIGPNLLQAIVLKRLSGRYVRCLDQNLLSSSQILTSCYMSSLGSDLVLLHGNRGLYDGNLAGSIAGSDAELAILTRTPVTLVVDGRGFGNSVAALFKGFSDFGAGFDLIGAILNNLSSEQLDEHPRQFYDHCMRQVDLAPTLGVVPQLPGTHAVPPRGASQQKIETSIARQLLIDLGNLVSQHVDIEELVEKAGNVVSLRLESFEHKPSARRARIAVSDDSCFNICFQDNLDLLRYHGAELVSFSPLADSSLPDNIGGLYLCGACLNEYAGDIAANQSMRDSIRDFAHSGGVVYSEGSGTAYLCDQFHVSDQPDAYPGVGLIPGTAQATQYQFNYIEGVSVEDSILGRPGLILKGIMTGEWALRGSNQMMRSFRVSYDNSPPEHEGFSPGAQIVSTFMFIHMGSNPELAKNFVDSVEIAQRTI